MSLLARLDVERSFRVPVGRPGTLRDSSRSPVDVAVDNLSTTGCLLRADDDLAIDTLISLGIPGIGVHQARIIRAEQPLYGCEFLKPISLNAVQVALRGETSIERIFPMASEVKPAFAMKTALLDQARYAATDIALTPGGKTEDFANAFQVERKLPMGSRVAIILGTSAGLWALILSIAVAIVR